MYFEKNDTMDALIKEALTEFEESLLCRAKITGRKHQSVAVSSSTSAVKNLTRELVSQGEGSR